LRGPGPALKEERLTVSPLNLALLVGAAFCAATVDAIAGGGGLLTVPALMAAGLPPHAVLGTNKGQALFGPLAAILRYRHAGIVDTRAARFTVPLAFGGALAGAALAMRIQPTVLRPIILGLLIAAGAFVVLARPQTEGPGRVTARRAALVLAASALGIGAYDGFFGPGTGTFLIVVLVAVAGRTFARASADAKVVNFASNVAAASLFAWHGVIHWEISLPMAGANLAGGFLGAHLAVRRGDRLIRAAVFLVVAALVAKIARDMAVDAGFHVP
jgi:uncharacterized membrane protein YfcA